MKIAKDFNITKEEFEAIREEAQWRPFLRKFELDVMFRGFGKGHFGKALELGCGSGEHSKHLAVYCKKLIALEYNQDNLTASSDEKTTFMIGDAQDLSQFDDNEMDLVFSSNLIEHLPNLVQCMRECRRVIKEDGLIVHSVPNRAFKIVTTLLYYPYQVVLLFRLLLSAGKSSKPDGSESARVRLDSNLRPMGVKEPLIKKLLRKSRPKVHGISRSNLSEFISWGQKQWIDVFNSSGLEVVDIIRLPFYHAYGYDFRTVHKLGNYMGLSASTAYVLKRSKDV